MITNPNEKTIILITCIKRKKTLNTIKTQVFRRYFKWMIYTQNLYDAHIYIISKKCELLNTNEEKIFYDINLNRVFNFEFKNWIEEVIKKFQAYYKYLVKEITPSQLPCKIEGI